jgi:putative nucleotidyltransferase with HDIG domain
MSIYQNTLTNQFRASLPRTTTYRAYEPGSDELAHANEIIVAQIARAYALRDPEVITHGRQVAALAVRIGQKLGLDRVSLRYLRWGALLHDIGKLQIAGEILYKPGPLDDHEWAVIRQHPISSYKMAASQPLLQPVLDILLYHHEQWAGGGYPYGLQQQEIPLSARICAVADVWDALRSNRCYHKAWSAAAAREHIAERAGTHFDPRVVQAFMPLVSHIAP